MKIISVKTLRDFWAENPDAEQPLKAWVDEATKADWKTPAEIKDQYRSASILKNKRVVFNIKGNDYRLIVAVAYLRGWVFVKFIGSHKEYDEINHEYYFGLPLFISSYLNYLIYKNIYFKSENLGFLC